MPEQHSAAFPRHLAPTLRQPKALNGSGFFLRLAFFASVLAIPTMPSDPAMTVPRIVRREPALLRERTRVSKRPASMAFASRVARKSRRWRLDATRANSRHRRLWCCWAESTDRSCQCKQRGATVLLYGLLPKADGLEGGIANVRADVISGTPPV